MPAADEPSTAVELGGAQWHHMMRAVVLRLTTLAAVASGWAAPTPLIQPVAWSLDPVVMPLVPRPPMPISKLSGSACT